MASSKTGGAKNKKAARPTESQNHNEMKTTEIRDLIDFIAQSGLNEVDVETKELKLHVKREPDQKVMKAAAPVMAAPMAVAAPAPVSAPAPAAPKAEKPVAVASKTVDIKSPMIGTFYRSSNPDSPPFASVGDKVS